MPESNATLLSTPSFRIGVWNVHPRHMNMVCERGTRKMTRKMMEVLIVLAQHRGNIVGKEELMAAVWPDVYVSEGTVRRTISMLRQLFDDDAATPRYIETVPGVGYRLIATMEKPTERGSDSPRQKTNVLDAVPAFFWFLFAGLALAIILWTRAAEIPESAVRRVQATSFHGDEFSPSLSPDASRIAFVHVANNDDSLRADLYVKLADSEPYLRLTDDDGFEASPAWSPDGLHLAYVNLHMESCGIYRIAAIGGSARKLATCHGLSDGSLPAISWSADGRRIVYSHFDEERRKTMLLCLELESNVETACSAPEPNEHDIHPVFAPKSNLLAFVRQRADGGSDLFTVENPPLSPAKKIYTSSSPLWNLHWNASETSLYFVTDGPAQTPEMWRVSASGHLKRRLQLPEGATIGHGISIRNGRLAYEEFDADANLWTANLHTKHRARLSISSTRFDVLPAVSPDGRRIAFLSNRSGTVSLWIGTTESAAVQELTPMIGTDFSNLAWEVKGDFIYYSSNTGIVRIDTGTGENATVSQERPQHLFTHPEGGVLYSIDTGKASSIRRLHPSGATETLMSLDPGETLYGAHAHQAFTSSAARPAVLWRNTLNESAERTAIQLDFEANETAPVPWIFTGDGFYYTRNRQDIELVFFAFETASSRLAFSFPAGQLRGVSISESSKTMVYGLETFNGIDIQLIDHFDQGF